MGKNGDLCSFRDNVSEAVDDVVQVTNRNRKSGSTGCRFVPVLRTLSDLERS